MTTATAAPRIDRRLVAALALLDDRAISIAELNRRIGVVALRLGLTRPSYEQVRVLVHALRQPRVRAAGESVVLAIATRATPSRFASLFRRRRRASDVVTVCYLSGPRVLIRGSPGRRRSGARAAR